MQDVVKKLRDLKLLISMLVKEVGSVVMWLSMCIT